MVLISSTSWDAGNGTARHGCVLDMLTTMADGRRRRNGDRGTRGGERAGEKARVDVELNSSSVAWSALAGKDGASGIRSRRAAAAVEEVEDDCVGFGDPGSIPQIGRASCRERVYVLV